jgi:hypothetical protein
VGRGYSGWADTAHRFYDLMLTGQPTEDFWEKVTRLRWLPKCVQRLGT